MTGGSTRRGRCGGMMVFVSVEGVGGSGMFESSDRGVDGGLG